MANGDTKLVSRTGGTIGNDDSVDPKISNNGKFVIFHTEATNLHSDGNGHSQDVLRRGAY